MKLTLSEIEGALFGKTWSLVNGNEDWSFLPQSTEGTAGTVTITKQGDIPATVNYSLYVREETNVYHIRAGDADYWIKQLDADLPGGRLTLVDPADHEKSFERN